MPEHVNRTLLRDRKAAYDEATARAAAAVRELEDARRGREKARGELVDAIEVAQTVDGLTWREIGEQLGVTAQAASQLYKRARG